MNVSQCILFVTYTCIFIFTYMPTSKKIVYMLIEIKRDIDMNIEMDIDILTPYKPAESAIRKQ